MIKIDDIISIEIVDDQPSMDGWEDVDPSKAKAGHFIDPHGIEHEISLEDPHALGLANASLTDGVFQFDTALAKQILQNGVKRFEDLLFFNAAGHPGPMQSIPEAMENRDDASENWKHRLQDIHPELYEILKDTYGIILWQEQLAAIWQRLAGFTSPEAQEARKAVAKKWTHKLKPIGEKWLAGATPNIGAQNAKMLWDSMVSFGRYAFNKCLAKSTWLTDEATGQIMSVEDWYNLSQRDKGASLPRLRSVVNGHVVMDHCVAIHYTDVQEVHEVIFDNGQIERVTMNHKFLCADGLYHEVREIIDQGLEVVEALPSRSEIFA